MSQTNPPNSDKNSAVVIDQDGKIEYHISTENNNEHAKKQTLKDIETSLNTNEVVPVNIGNSLSSALEQIRQSRIMPYFVLALILIILLMGQYIYSHNTEDIAQIPSQPGNIKQSVDPQDSPAVVEIKVIAKLLHDIDELDLNIMQAFNEKWQNLDNESQQSLNESFWFRRFSELLQQKITDQQIFIQTVTSKSKTHKNIAEKTAEIIGMPNSTIAELQAKSESGITEIFQEISDEIARVESEKLTLTDDVQNNNIDNSNTKANEKPDTLAAPAANTANLTAAKPASAKSPENKAQELKNTKGFTEFDANYLLGQYAATYEFGKTKYLLSFFSGNKKYRKQLKRSFNKVFKQSSKRQILFSNIIWKFNKNSIIGKGDYRAEIKLKHNKGTRIVNANIKVKLKPIKSDLKIAALDFFKVQSDVKKPPSTKNRKSAAKSKPVAKLGTTKVNGKSCPTSSELQDVILRFTAAYESGNLVAFDDIFSTDIKTNKKNSLAGIKQDYFELFNTTSDRQLFIEDINWSFDNNRAKGTGKVSVLLISQDSDEISTKRGEIRIVAKKTNHKTMITRLYHTFYN